ncbi:hypothetical protein HK413_03220 [Mucilaginibacter sp. S1162]|uniref:Uncharacterized protein n=1 Tax=Mucilaginibacter humi TaxID=2732510 RepID=A0ABX1W180_9SPHI|nr:hypothetical protein [Mucilaginibacter humi]NNU33411.1 hypothetical protein [Mucilaginibacter humi]
MIALRYNFDHPFQGKVILRKTGYKHARCRAIYFDSADEHDFNITLQVDGDGTYQVVLNWEFEGRSFSHESSVTVKNGQHIHEDIY